MAAKGAIGQKAEEIVAQALVSKGYEITNLNSLVRNCPFMDLLATKPKRRGPARRLLVQVKGTTNAKMWFGAQPSRARALDQFASAFGCTAEYAFVYVDTVGARPVVQFAAAKDVAQMAEEAEESYPGTNRYHVAISQGRLVPLVFTP